VIKVLGSYGNRGRDAYTTAFLIRDDIVIDAGNLANGLGDDVNKIEHIFLTHSHFDHILDLPFVIDTNFENRKNSLKIYGLKETIDAIKTIFNNRIWPDFATIELLNGKKAIEFIEIKPSQTICFENISIKAIKANHSVPALGYKITKQNQSVILSGDTYLNDELIQEINTTPNLKALLLEISFPSRLTKLAQVAKHLTPVLVKQILSKIPPTKLFFYHFKVEYKSEILQELEEFEYEYSILEDGMCIFPFEKRQICIQNRKDIKKLLKIGVELSSQKDINYLLEDILSVAREFTEADAGSVYLKEGDRLYFKIIQNDTLNIFMGGRNEQIKWKPLNLYIDGKENRNMVAALSALTQKIYNIPNVYEDTNFDFSGTKKFDESTGYFSKSMLVIPLINHEKETIGVLQLINKKIDNQFISFNKEDEDITMSLASQAAVSITKNKLIEQLEEFIESFIKVIAKAVDEKSKYTGNHVQKVAKLAKILSQAINEDEEYFKDIKYSQNMLKQIEIAALLHDIGKITTDPRIMDKATKLEADIDRIDIISERVEIIKRDMLLKGIDDFSELLDDFKFLKEVNIGGEYMDDEKIVKIEEIAKKYQYLLDNKVVSLVREDEVAMLKIRKGTLSEGERAHIQRHALMTLEMLSALPFPKGYKEITHIAANHHEKLNGKGYPRGLSKKDLTFEDRLLAICDIFEALTASDRPYKQPKKLSEVFRIMEFMVKDQEIDEKLFRFFKEKEIWKIYKDELLPIQIDI
jgi:HD-GYP domain-containing protein (c-di-GMP phosphodiesterase class II)/ribonuclease BN (tRNA processing enzyme)